MTVTRTDGNVTYADFGGRGEPDPAALPLLSCSCDLLYCDQFVVLSRLTYRVGGRVFVQHVMTEVTPDV